MVTQAEEGGEEGEEEDKTWIHVQTHVEGKHEEEDQTWMDNRW
jgi:hypothetical protein